MMSREALQTYSATEAALLIRTGQLSAVELVDACLRQIERLEPRIHAWTYLAPESAREAAREIDGTIQRGEDPGPLAGVPFGIKDIFNTRDMPTQMGSPLWSGFTPGNDARVVAQLRLAGGVILGKTVTAEFAVHAPGPTVNPHDPAHAPGTSSSGSAAAVAASMVPLALASQTAGSTIRPASYCGIYGFKPSFGLLPRTGSLKTTDTLDSIACCARTIEDLCVMFDVLRVHGADYPISHRALTDPARQKPDDRPWRVAVVKGPKWSDAEPYAQEALMRYAEDLARQPGLVVEHVELPPAFDEAHDVHDTIYEKTLWYYFQEEFREEMQQSHLISPQLKAMIRRGQEIPLSAYRAALARQVELSRMLDRWFAQSADVLLTLSTGGEAMRGLETPDRPDTCLIWTMCWVPAISAPVFVGPAHLPFGAQFVAPRYRDLDLLRFCWFLRQRDLAPEGPFPPLPMEQSATVLHASHAQPPPSDESAEVRA